jgi:RNA polymerase-binding transcription factor DksA
MAQYDEAAIRSRLEADRLHIKQEIYRQIQGDESVSSTDPLLDTGGMSTDPADDADALANHERTQILVSNAQSMVEQINAALERLDAGTYGICTHCSKQIDPRRLGALPYVTSCIDCQAAAEAASIRRRL